MSVHYFPVSQEINSDAETWELTKLHGDRALRTWFEVLSIMDRTNNAWKLVDGWETVIARKVRQSPATVWATVGWLLAKGWLIVRQGLASGPPVVGQCLASGWPAIRQSLASDPPTILGCRNYAKFRKMAAEATLSPNQPNQPTKLTNSAAASGFESFWQAYPKKKAKGDAEKAWKSIKPTADLVANILGAVASQAASEEWTKDAGQFIPHPATWLRAKCWQDETGQPTQVARRVPLVVSPSNGHEDKPLPRAEALRRLAELTASIGGA